MDSLLQTQRTVLLSIVTDLETAIAALPSQEPMGWWGTAQAYYSLWLAKVVADATLALDTLRSALAATEAALQAVAADE